MSSLGDRRVNWFLNHGRRKAARKRMPEGNLDRLIFNPGATSRRAPRISLSYCKIGILEKDKSICCAEVALSAYSRDVDGEFELVEVVGSMYFPFVLLVHCNFIARPKGSTAAEDRLFFAELQGKLQAAVGGARPDTIFTCQGYYILDSTIAGTGLSGCECCDRNPGYIKHPAAGGFTTHVDRPW